MTIFGIEQSAKNTWGVDYIPIFGTVTAAVKLPLGIVGGIFLGPPAACVQSLRKPAKVCGKTIVRSLLGIVCAPAIILLDVDLDDLDD